MINRKPINIVIAVLFSVAAGIATTYTLPEAFASNPFIQYGTTFNTITSHSKLQAKSGEIYLPETIEHCVFNIEVENKNNDYNIVLKSPSGRVYSTGESGDIVKIENSYTLSLPEAEQGLWTCEVSGIEIGKVRVEAGETPDFIRINKLSYNENDETLSWQISYAIGDIYFKVTAISEDMKTPIKEFISQKADGFIHIKKEDIPKGTIAIELTVSDKTSIPDTFTIAL